MEKLEEIATNLRKELAKIDAIIASKPQPNSLADIQKKLADMYDVPAWKTFVMKLYGVAFNMWTILDELYDDYWDAIQHQRQHPHHIIGRPTSALWADVKFEIMQRTISPEKMDEDFEDTANGCDEILDKKGWEVITERISRM